MTKDPWRSSLIVLAAMTALAVWLVSSLNSPLESIDGRADVVGTTDPDAEASEREARISEAKVVMMGNVAAAFGVSYALAILFAWLISQREREHRPIATRHVPTGDSSVPESSAGAPDRPPLIAADDDTIRRQDDRSSTDLMQLERRVRTDFIATISHEIRTPINTVIGMADLLKLTELTRKQKSYVQHMQSSGEVLLNLVDNILDFAGLQEGTLTIRPKEFSLTCLVERVLEIMGHAAYSKGLELTVTLRSNPSTRITADKDRLCQVLINLVANSVKFTDDGDIDIEVDVRQQNSRISLLRLIVSDTGHGFDCSDKEMIFTPFASNQRRATQNHEGSGLGLPICKRLVDSMRGTIDVESSIGIGTRVTIEVPVSERRLQSSDTRLLSNDGAGPARILIAHANPSAGRSIAELLEGWGAECVLASTPETAIECLSTAVSDGHPFDRAILDADLTPADPLMLASEIRGETPARRLPIVLLNAIVRPLEIGTVSRIPGIRCVDKPVLPSALHDNLSHMPDSEPHAATQAVLPRKGRSLRILVAEDNVVNGQLLLSMLRAEGHEAEGARDPRAIFSAMERNTYDIVLMDGRMPGMDGDCIARLIRSNPERFASQPVIVAVTAEATEQFRSQCLAAGMNDFITKPVRLDELRACIDRWTFGTHLARDDEADGMEDTQSALALRLVERIGDQDDNLVRRYIDLFLLDTEERLIRISRAIDARDADLIRQECHAVKGACLEFGAERMVRCCEKLATAAKRNRAAELKAAHDALEEEFVRLRPLFGSATVTLH